MKRAILFLSLIALAGAAHAGELRATATLVPDEISFGDAAQLNIQIEGSANADRPQMPEIPGLEITRVGQSTSIQFRNGAMSGGVTYIYQVLPEKPGTFTIPGIVISTGGQSATTNPVTLRVLKSSSSYQVMPQPPQTPTTLPGQMAQPPGFYSQPQPQQAPPPQAPAGAGAAVASIQLSYPKRDFYVGELVPADLSVYLHRGLSIAEISVPQVSGSAFTVGKLGNKPERHSQIIDGKPYDIFTWHTAIAAVKAGEHPLGAKVECVVEVESRRRQIDDFFNDPFFDRFFRNTERKLLPLEAPEATVKVLPLPEEGRPADFSGAIGNFEIAADASPREVTAGDPIKLNLTISGAGNFDRVKAPELGRNHGFKTYSPSARFEPEDASGSQGRKFFEQMVVPESPDLTSIPRIHFSFFDPEDKKYITLAAAEIPIKVKPAAGAPPASAPVASQQPAAQTQPQAQQPAPNAGTMAADSALVANKSERGRVTSSMKPVLMQAWFWGVQSVPAAALLGAFVIARRRRRLETDPAFARALSAGRAVQAQLVALDAALGKQSADEFFHAARRALQERLAERLGRKPETITLADLEAGEMPASLAGVVPELRAVFEVADAVAYSGQRYSAESLREWRDRVHGILKQMEKLR